MTLQLVALSVFPDWFCKMEKEKSHWCKYCEEPATKLVLRGFLYIAFCCDEHSSWLVEQLRKDIHAEPLPKSVKS